MSVCVFPDNCLDDEERPQLEAHLELFELTELIWNLCEVLFIDTPPGTVRFHPVEHSNALDYKGGANVPCSLVHLYFSTRLRYKNVLMNIFFKYLYLNV